MKIIGIAKFTSKKKGQRMAKIQCLRPFTDQDRARLELSAGEAVEDVWLYEPLMDKVDASCVGKDLKPVYEYYGGRPTIVDVIIK